jgi:GTP-sensing pleiotropic transcriptional regulator CodY
MAEYEAIKAEIDSLNGKKGSLIAGEVFHVARLAAKG